MKFIKYSLSILSIFFLVFFLPEISNAQKGVIRGFVYEKETGEPVIYTNVYLYKTSHGAATDINGFFSITKIPIGDYTLMVTYLGFDTLKMNVTVMQDQIITKKLYLEKASYMLEQVQVTADREEARTETRTSVIKITPKQINKLPTIGGKADLAQYLQVLPGVVFTGDQGGQLYIRGGSPVQNMVLLDGMIVYNPFHSIGLFSVFDTDILRNVEVYTGGFGAEYGGRISSVMDITTRDGNKSRFSGKVGASTFGANVMVEGPIGPGGISSFIFSAKHSYLEQSSKVFYEYIDENGLPFNYTDIYGKISVVGSNGSKVNFFGFRFDDKVNNYKALSDYHWKSGGIGANFLVIPGNSPVLIEGHFAYSQYKIALEEETTPMRTSSINGSNLGFDFTYFFGKDEFKWGVELLSFTTVFDITNSLGLGIQHKNNSTDLGIYLKYKKTIGKVLLEPSFRFHYYSTAGLSLEPRLAFKYNVTDNFRIKFAGGLYSQDLTSAHSRKDIVNLFNGFISGASNVPDDFDGEEITSNLQKGEHAILGFEYDLARHIIVNIEGYYKNFSQLTNINPNKLLDDDKYPEESQILTKDFIHEKGYATGADFTLKFDKNRLYLWVVYSLGYVIRKYEDIDGQVKEYYPHYDRRHNVNFVATYVLGDKYNWEINARWNYGSGFPFTLTKGYYPLVTFMDGIYTDYTTAPEDLGILYADLNTGRLPPYHRLDIGVNKTFTLGRYTKLEANVSVTNVYNRENIFYVDRVTGERVYQLPIMPSVGLTFSF